MFNLLSNAVKFTPDGGSVSVKAQILPTPPLVKGGEGGFCDFIEISVEDAGAGIPPEGVEKLFQPFQQIDSVLTKKHKGTGLGLSLCRQFIELHSGRIWVESEVGKGSKFKFTIPIRQ
jgi:signal transduction histidine kinase